MKYFQWFHSLWTCCCPENTDSEWVAGAVRLNGYRLTGKFGPFVYRVRDSSGDEKRIKAMTGSHAEELFSNEKRICDIFLAEGDPLLLADEHFSVDHMHFIVTKPAGKGITQFSQKVKPENERKMVHRASREAFAMIEALQALHDRHIIHRNLTPNSFVYTDRREDTIRMLIKDFEFAALFRDGEQLFPEKREELHPLMDKTFKSVSAHMGYSQSRKDYLQSLVYILFSMIRKLSWQTWEQEVKTKKIPLNQADKWLETMKLRSTPESLISGFKDYVPKHFASFARRVMRLKFYDEPNYAKYLNDFTPFDKR